MTTLIEQYRTVIALFMLQNDNLVALLDHYEAMISRSFGRKFRAEQRQIITEIRQHNQGIQDTLAEIGMMTMEQE